MRSVVCAEHPPITPAYPTPASSRVSCRGAPCEFRNRARACAAALTATLRGQYPSCAALRRLSP